MVQIGGWGRRSPFSRMSGISLVGIPSYGLPPNVISSQMVTPGWWRGGKEKRDIQREMGGWDKEPENNREQDKLWNHPGVSRERKGAKCKSALGVYKSESKFYKLCPLFSKLLDSQYSTHRFTHGSCFQRLIMGGSSVIRRRIRGEEEKMQIKKQDFR